MANCSFCGKSAGLFRRKHNACEDLAAAGYRKMVRLTAQAVIQPDFDEVHLQQALAKVAKDSFVDRAGIRAAIAGGWQEAARAVLGRRGDAQEDETRLLEVKQRLTLNDYSSSTTANSLRDRGTKRAVDSLMVVARQAALPSADAEAKMQDLHNALDQSDLSPDQQRNVLADAWGEASRYVTRDRMITEEEAEALSQFQLRFNLLQRELDRSGAYMHFLKVLVLSEAASGTIVKRLNVPNLPVNLQSSEQLVWAFDNVDYYEVITHSEFRGGSQGVGIPVAKGVYYNPQQIRGQLYEREETVKTTSGILAITTKHVYFHGGGKSFRIPYSEIVSFQEFQDGLGVMRDHREAKPERFCTGDGWFVYGLVSALAKL